MFAKNTSVSTSCFSEAQNESSAITALAQNALSSPSASAPTISKLQFFKYFKRQEEIDRVRMNDTLANVSQLLFGSDEPTTASTLPSIPVTLGGNNNEIKIEEVHSTTTTAMPNTTPAGQKTNSVKPNTAGNILVEENLLFQLLLLLEKMDLSVDKSFLKAERKPNEVDIVEVYYLTQHVQEDHGGQLHCRDCSKKYKTHSGMTKHYAIFHQKGFYQCSRCRLIKEMLKEAIDHWKKCMHRGTSVSKQQPNFVRSNIDVNLMLPTSNPQLQPSILTAAATSVFQTTTVSSSTRRPLPGGGKSGNKNNISKHIPWANILSLKCTEPTSEKALCGKEVVTEDELLRHQRFRHGILKYRCLNKGCSRSFDRRMYREAHVATAHTSGLHCRNCPKHVQTSHGLEGHFQLYHQKGLYQCIRCDTVKEYLVEMRKHTKLCSKNSANNFIEPPRNLRSSGGTISSNVN
ncbi:hypothetical protein TYRP_022358 [Tyrophagus putrescentiae]|nr:hypothetical protein TYRP_022358 [Tyrophagus putrescentiae]